MRSTQSICSSLSDPERDIPANKHNYHCTHKCYQLLLYLASFSNCAFLDDSAYFSLLIQISVNKLGYTYGGKLVQVQSIFILFSPWLTYPIPLCQLPCCSRNVLCCHFAKACVLEVLVLHLKSQTVFIYSLYYSIKVPHCAKSFG